MSVYDRLVVEHAVPARNRADDAGKRALDLVLGSILSVIALPFIVIFGIGVAISLRCWPFFSHARPGRNGTEITLVKLRTLPPSTPTYADKFVLQIDDMRLPWLCQMLRRTHLDELPQLFLVVSGTMSLVGPRPGQHPLLERFDDDFNALRTSVRPGCTGLWQIGAGSRGSIADSPHFDLFYLSHSSVRFDLWILARTVPWLFGLVQPIEVTDVPRWVLGRSRVIIALPDSPGADRSHYSATTLERDLVYPHDLQPPRPRMAQSDAALD